MGLPGTIPETVTFPETDFPFLTGSEPSSSFFSPLDAPRLIQNSSGRSLAFDSQEANVQVSTFQQLGNRIQSVFAPMMYAPGSSDPGLIPSQVVSTSSQGEIHTWLSQYAFQVWPLGKTHLVLYRNDIMTITRFPVVLCLSRLCFKVQLEDGTHKQVTYYPDSAWQYTSSLGLLDEDSHEDSIILTEEGGEIVYKMEGMSSQFMLAAFPVKVCKRLSISAETEEIKSYESCTMWDSIIDVLSLRAGRGT